MTGTRDAGGASRREPAEPLSVQQRLAEAMAELETVQAGVARAEEELRNATVTVRSRDRAVEVTVGPQGELTGLKFLDGKYRTMAAAELAASVLESAGQARTQMSRRVMETFKPFTEPSTTVPELTGVDVDWARIFGPGVLEEPETATGRGGDRRLRDEIDEDAEDEANHG
ncbi:YbaB/EbfC family nucleoid-associated protein [Streptomyces sp. NPDC092129]|uniref:YbaB/EbfC family nucleoid-associated protein n=1 Tax=Streptomyces sp. NPDC092129 TaxID=3366010 RepID=UPI0037F5F81E